MALKSSEKEIWKSVWERGERADVKWWDTGCKREDRGRGRRALRSKLFGCCRDLMLYVNKRGGGWWVGGGWGFAGGEVYLHCTAMSNQNQSGHAGTKRARREKRSFFFFLPWCFGGELVHTDYRMSTSKIHGCLHILPFRPVISKIHPLTNGALQSTCAD